MRNKIVIGVVALIFVFVGTGRAETVSLDLSTLGIPTNFNHNSSYWQTNFDLGVTFTEISHVHIDWSGEITAGLARHVDPTTHLPIGDPFPLEVGPYAYMSGYPYTRIVSAHGGQTSYPLPEVFNLQSEFVLSGTANWSDLLDGKGILGVGLSGYLPVLDQAVIIEYGSFSLDSAVLMVDGTVVPEPGTLMLLGFGFTQVLQRKKC
jgi:hypothetical protein